MSGIYDKVKRWPGILPDKEIKFLAEKKNMIAPCAPHISGADIISYGVSSFGYDARLGTDLKVIMGQPAQKINPKCFDPTLAVDLLPNEDGDYVIPPGGFVLGHTVEYFSIPDDILVICLGKSTYARCFSGDTLVHTEAHGPKSFKDLVDLYGENTPFDGVGIDEKTGERVITPLVAPRIIGKDTVSKVGFVAADSVVVTDDHEWILRDISVRDKNTLWNTRRVQTKDLKPGMRVASKESEHGAHIVESVSVISGEQDVYCLTAPKTGNFALGNGCFVSNCGLIVNVTPLEPGWSGQVTLELHNTTFQPIVIHPNEGICQFLFLRGESRPTVTYADRKGKYIGQKGVTLPRMPPK